MEQEKKKNPTTPRYKRKCCMESKETKKKKPLEM